MSGLFPVPPSFSPAFENEISITREKIRATYNAMVQSMNAADAVHTVNELSYAVSQTAALKNGVSLLLEEMRLRLDSYREYTTQYQQKYAAWQAEVNAALDSIVAELEPLRTPYIKYAATYIKDGRWYNNAISIEIPLRGFLEVSDFPRYTFSTKVQPHQSIAMLFVDPTNPQSTSIETVNTLYKSVSDTLIRYFDVLCREFGIPESTGRAIFEPFVQTYLFECFSSLPFEDTIYTYGRAAGHYESKGNIGVWNLGISSKPESSIDFLFNTAFPNFRALVLNSAEMSAFNFNEQEQSNILQLEYLRRYQPATFSSVMLQQYGVEVPANFGAPASGLGRPLTLGYSWGDFKRDVRGAFSKLDDEARKVVKKLAAIFLPDFVEDFATKAIREIKTLLPILAPGHFILNGDFDSVRLALRKIYWHPIEKTFIPDDIYKNMKQWEQEHRSEIKIVGAIIVAIFAAYAVGPLLSGISESAIGGYVGDVVYGTADWFMGLVEIAEVKASISITGAVTGLTSVFTDWKTHVVAAVDDKVKDEVKDAVNDAINPDKENATPPVIVEPGKKSAGIGIFAALAALAIATQ